MIIFDNLTIKYDQPEKIAIGLIESEKIIDETRFTQNDNKENILYQDLSFGKETIVFNDLDKKINNYQIEGKNIFNYQIYLDDLVEDNTIFYQIDFLNGDKINFNQIISDYYFDSNIINFNLSYNIFETFNIC